MSQSDFSQKPESEDNSEHSTPTPGDSYSALEPSENGMTLISTGDASVLDSNIEAITRTEAMLQKAEQSQGKGSR